MRPIWFLVLVTLVISVPIALIGEALAFGDYAWMASLVVGGWLVSLFDRDRFYGRDLLKKR